MTGFDDDLRLRVGKAVQHYWKTRLRQQEKQGSKTGRKDQGLRTAVTGGAHLDGFVALIRELLVESGLKDAEVFTARAKTVIPGFFRPTKAWDLVAVANGRLIACVELKSQAGPSYGNNLNNRVEEALGNAIDVLKAYEAGAFAPSPKPFLGYLMLLERDHGSTHVVSTKAPHFPPLQEFRNTSYAQRYALFCQKLVREGFYDGAAFMLASREGGLRGEYTEPVEEFSFSNLAVGLIGRAVAFAKQRAR